MEVNYRELVVAEQQKLNELLEDKEFTSNTFGDGLFTTVIKPTEMNNKPDFVVEAVVKTSYKKYLEKQFCLRIAIENDLISIDKELKTEIEKIIQDVDNAFNLYKEESEKQLQIMIKQNAEEVERRTKAREAALLKKAQEKEEAKLQAKFAKSEKDFNDVITSRVVVKEDIVEWIKENAVSINATIPNHLEKTFIKVFGEQTHKTVDSRRKTSGGYSMKFGPSFSIVIKSTTTTVPELLVKKIKKNTIHDTALISNLVRAYGLKFGKQGE